MLYALAEQYQAFEWTNPHWGWFFCGCAAGAILTVLLHRIRAG